MKEPPDTVVLGCTHFPLIAEELKSALPDGTRLVDSGAAIARRVQWLINNSEKPHHLTAEKMWRIACGMMKRHRNYSLFCSNWDSNR